MKIPKSHPRYESLMMRELIAKGVEKGITSQHGLIAHGRGEAFDYLIGEKTSIVAKKSIDSAAALLLLAKQPVISVNGNAAALVPKELATLSSLLNAPLEVNIFHPSKKRELRIKAHLENYGAKNVLLPDKRYKIRFLESNRKYINPNGILKADVVFVPLEDGDRAEALIKNGKKIIAVDLNPLARTANNATVTIVDNITRAMPLLIKATNRHKKYARRKLESIVKNFNNKETLKEAIKQIRRL
ncbi:phosphopantothenate/pantothenate synthetase [Candidatus Woesearchaeota archaeon]|nr:phosphopantothenate/pantothenate synthetase [Candidatus Woesearchaeota archaeon]